MLNNWFGDAGVWKSSKFSDLPEVWVDAPETVAHFLVVAGGLSLMLSRASENEVKRSLTYSSALHGLLRRELKQHGRVSATAELLNEVMHECGHLVDSATRNSLKACLAARVEYDAARRGSAPSPLPGSSKPRLSKDDVDSSTSGNSTPNGKGGLSWLAGLRSRGQKDPTPPGAS